MCIVSMQGRGLSQWQPFSLLLYLLTNNKSSQVKSGGSSTSSSKYISLGFNFVDHLKASRGPTEEPKMLARQDNTNNNTLKDNEDKRLCTLGGEENGRAAPLNKYEDAPLLLNSRNPSRLVSPALCSAASLVPIAAAKLGKARLAQFRLQHV